MENKNEIIRKNWFSDHVAEYTQVNDKISILNWRKPNSSIYSVRYVMDGCRLYVSGDLGEAVFNLTWNATPESFEDINLGYFHEKLAAFHGDRYSFSSEEAVERLQEEINNLENNYQDYGYDSENDEEFIDRISTLELMQDVATDCSKAKEWETRIAYDGYDPLFDQLQKYDNDCWEWIFEIGNVIPRRVRAYLIGLKMANEQLKGDDE